MTINEYQELAMRTSNKELSASEHFMNGVLGLTGESGEVADLVKKVQFQGHAFSAQHIAKELGDILWYVCETATAIDYDLETIMVMNIVKLQERYPNGFDPEKSMNRKQNDI